MKIVFMGSAEFGLPSLKMIAERHEVAGIVSTPARPKGRGLKLFDSPVTECAKDNGLAPVFTPESLSDAGFINELKSINPDLFVVIAFRILPREVFTIPRLGTVNVHASLLPKYRGAAPIHRAIEAGERETGVTVFRIDDGVDTGEIIVRKKIAIGDEETTPELYERLSLLGVDALSEAMEGLSDGSARAIAQDPAEATRAPKLSRIEGHIDWSLSSTAIFNKIRAFKPFPGTYFFVGGKKINIEWGSVVDDTASPYKNIDANPGEVLYSRGGHIDVRCGEGVLRVTKIKPEGRPSMDVKAFLLGHTIAEGTALE